MGGEGKGKGKGRKTTVVAENPTTPRRSLRNKNRWKKDRSTDKSEQKRGEKKDRSQKRADKSEQKRGGKEKGEGRNSAKRQDKDRSQKDRSQKRKSRRGWEKGTITGNELTIGSVVGQVTFGAVNEDSAAFTANIGGEKVSCELSGASKGVYCTNGEKLVMKCKSGLV